MGERQEYNERAETTYVTLLELIERDSLDLRCYFDDIDTPDQGTSANVHEAWVATGHIEELRALQNIDDPKLFRQICYEVMLSTVSSRRKETRRLLSISMHSKLFLALLTLLISFLSI